MSLILVDASADSLTVSWPETPGARRYVLEYRRASDSSFQTLSDQLTKPQARKRNLSDDSRTGFVFRARAVTTNPNAPYQTHSEPFFLLTKDENTQRLEPPTVSHPGSNQSLLIQWKSVGSSENKYELQMRENKGGCEWNTIASSLGSTEVKKKNLTSAAGYQFRVRPVTEDKAAPFSPPSDPMVARGLAPGLQRWFSSLEDGTLLSKKEPLPLADALGGKEFVLLYVSAHWCGPCRYFTPKLSQWYQSQQSAGNQNVEVVFLSADHDANSFRQYYSTMPWLAVNYDDDAREEIMATIQVTGIPRLLVLDGQTGRKLVDNAVSQPLDVNQWRALAKGNK